MSADADSVRNKLCKTGGLYRVEGVLISTFNDPGSVCCGINIELGVARFYAGKRKSLVPFS